MLVAGLYGPLAIQPIRRAILFQWPYKTALDGSRPCRATTADGAKMAVRLLCPERRASRIERQRRREYGGGGAGAAASGQAVPAGVQRAVDFILRNVENSPQDGLVGD